MLTHVICVCFFSSSSTFFCCRCCCLFISHMWNIYGYTLVALIFFSFAWCVCVCVSLHFKRLANAWYVMWYGVQCACSCMKLIHRTCSNHEKNVFHSFGFAMKMETTTTMFKCVLRIIFFCFFGLFFHSKEHFSHSISSSSNPNLRARTCTRSHRTLMWHELWIRIYVCFINIKLREKKLSININFCVSAPSVCGWHLRRMNFIWV